MRYRDLLWTDDFVLGVLIAIVVVGSIATAEPERFHAGYLWMLIVLPTVGFGIAAYRYKWSVDE